MRPRMNPVLNTSIDAVWKKIVVKYKLKDLTVEHIATWKFADMIFARYVFGHSKT